MPQLGLGLGLHKNSLGLTPLNLLKKYTSVMWHVPKATGISEGINSPLTNPLIDLDGVVGKNLFDQYSFLTLMSGSITIVDSAKCLTFRPTANVPVSIPINLQSGRFTYSYRARAELSDTTSRLVFVYSDGTKSSNSNNLSSTEFRNISDTSISGKTVVSIEWSAAHTRTVYIDENSFQLELGSVATTYEPYGKANLLLNGFAGTTASGYLPVLCPNGKTVPFLQFDGINDYSIANHPALDITGTGTFYFGNIIRTSALATQYFNIKAEQSEATTQYGLKLTNTGVLSIILNGTDIQLATGLLANTIYNVWVERDGGLLKCFINTAETSSVANATSLTTRPNFRWGALSTNVGGTTHTGFANVSMGTSVMGVTDATKARQAWFNFTLKTFGL